MVLEIVLVFVLIYLLTLLLSATKIVPLSIAALTGALLVAWFGLQYEVFTYAEASGFIDVKLLGLLIGTMVVVEVAKRSGLFRFAALYAVKLSKGSPGRLFVSICIISAVASMFLSDPTAMLLMAAATMTISKLLKYDPMPYLLSSIIMINLGGTSTLIGSTSNMAIGVAMGLSFSDFVGYLALCEVFLWALTILVLYILFKRRLGKRRALPEYSPWQSIENKKLFYQSTFIIILLLLLFITLENFAVGPEVVALGCAVLALIISGSDPAEIFQRLDWETVAFIAGFMFIVGGIQRTDALREISLWLFQFVGGSSVTTTLTTLWFSGLASTIVSNMAIALTFIPIIREFSALNAQLKPPVSSALVLGTNLGGATTPLSGSVVMMAVGTLKREGISMSFGEFTKVGLVTSLLQLGFSSLYLILRFGIGG